MNKNHANTFCLSILTLTVRHAKALANLVMSLASYSPSQSVTALSESPHFHYKYSSIADAINGLTSYTKLGELSVQIRKMVTEFYFLGDARSERIILISDATKLIKEHSPTLSETQYVHIANNVIAGNKPISIGLPISYINILTNDFINCLPLSIKRIGARESAVDVVLDQLKELWNEAFLKNCGKLVINLVDRGYACIAYFSETHALVNMVSIARLRRGQKVYLTDEMPKNVKGPKRIYGVCVYLHKEDCMFKQCKKGVITFKFQECLSAKAIPDECKTFEKITAKGRKLKITLSIYKNLQFRSKKGYSMKDKFFNIVETEIIDAQTGQRLYNQNMYLCISGERKDEISTTEAYEIYCKRFDIECYFRFAKQKLHLDKFQTPDVTHLDSWLRVVQLASWLLHTISVEARNTPKPWQKYSVKESLTSSLGTTLTLCQAQKAAEKHIYTFSALPFLPQKCKNGKGRKKGDLQKKRIRYPVVKKSKKPKKQINE